MSRHSPIRTIALLMISALWLLGCSDTPRSLAVNEADDRGQRWPEVASVDAADPLAFAAEDEREAAPSSPEQSEPALATPAQDAVDPYEHIEFIEDIQRAFRISFDEYTVEQLECIDRELAKLDSETTWIPEVIVAAFARPCAPERTIDWWTSLAWHEGGINLTAPDLRSCFAEVVLGVANLNPLEGAVWFPSDRFDPPNAERLLIDLALEESCGINEATGVAAGLRTTGAVALGSQLVDYCAAVANRSSTPGYGPGADAETTNAWLSREYSEFQALNPPVEIYSDHATRLLAVREALFLSIDQGLTYDEIQADSGYRAYADSDFGLPARTRIAEYERVNCIDRAEPGAWVPMIASRYDVLASLRPHFDEFSLLAQSACQSQAAGGVVDTSILSADVAQQLDELLSADCALLTSATAADIGTPQTHAGYQAAVDALVVERAFADWDPMLDELHAALVAPRYDRTAFELMAIGLCGEGLYGWQAQLDPRFNTSERAAAFVIASHCEIYDPAENAVADATDAPAVVALVDELTAPSGLLLLGERTADELVAHALADGQQRVVIGMTPLEPVGDVAELVEEVAAELRSLGLVVDEAIRCEGATDVPFNGSARGVGAGVISVDESTAPLVRIAIGLAGQPAVDVHAGVASCH